MPYLRWAALLVFLGPGQEAVLHVTVNHRDGHAVIGIPSISELKIDSSLGAVTIQIMDLAQIRFEGEEVVAVGRDKSTLKGKLKLEEFAVKGILGNVTIKRNSVSGMDVMTRPAYQESSPPDNELNIRLRSMDQNELVGTVEWAAVTCETSIGKYDLAAHQVFRFQRQGDKQRLMLKDGTLLVGKVLLPELKVRSGLGVFTVKPENISEIQVQPPLPRPRIGKREEPPAAPPPPAPAPGMKPLTTVNLKSALGNLQVSRDGSKMYVINVSEGKLLRWRLPGLEEDGSVQLAGVETAVAIDPSGAKIFAAGQKTISILSAEPLALKKSFQIESAIEDVVAVDKDTLLAVGSGTVLVSVSKTAVVEQYPVRGARIFMPRSEDRAYVGGGIFNIKRAADGSGQVEWVSSPAFSMTAAPITQISPDGRYACSHKGDGRMLRLGRCWAAAQVEAGKVDPHSAAAFSPDNSRLYLLTADGFLKVYSVPEFNLLGSHHLGVRGIQAFVPGDGKSIIVAGAAAVATPGRRQPRNNSMEVVDLYRFEIPQ